MRVQFVQKENQPEKLVCEAEVLFENEGPLTGMKLVGFSLWRSPEGEVYVTFPSRAFGSGNERRYYDYLRSVDGTLDVSSNSIPIVIGSPLNGCAGNSFGKNVSVDSNTAAISINANSVVKNLSCSNNAAITGAFNTAQKKEGQCAAF